MSKVLKRLLYYLLKIFYIFPVKNNKIYLKSFNGKDYNLDSKAIAEFINDNYQNKFDLVWEYSIPDNFKNIKNKSLRFVRKNTLKSIYEIITSKCVVYNVNPVVCIPYRKKQILCNTWHGGGLGKKCGRYLDNNLFDERQFNKTNIFISSSRAFTECYIRDSFMYKGKILNCGLPKNDILFKESKINEIRKKVFKKYNLKNENIMLYAPTFRNGTDVFEDKLDFEKIIKKLSEKFGGKWKIMFRLHPNIPKEKRIIHNNCIDVTDYSDIQELYCAANVLMTDYSSCMWDFSIMKKPIFLYVPDIEQYEKNRGLYESADKWPYIISKSEKELENAIENFDENKYKKNVESYHKRLGSYEDGHACEKVLDYFIKNGLK